MIPNISASSGVGGADSFDFGNGGRSNSQTVYMLPEAPNHMVPASKNYVWPLVIGACVLMLIWMMGRR